MKQTFSRLTLALVLASGMAAVASPAFAANNYPVVLVHGFAGFGRNEALGYKYWGGLTDLQETVKSQYADQKVYTAVVGPFSSNWDRATELYYQIKGGCVDYGSAHAQAHGHSRYGRCFPGLYPQWDAAHPVHLVSHSMGGQTTRALVQMLAANGAPNNAGLFGSTPVSSRWVKSVTTISSPNDGTTLANIITDYVPFVQGLVVGIGGLAGASDATTDNVYDFKMDQWDIAPKAAGETFGSYVSRVMASPLWNNKNVKDLSPYDLSPKGAADLNAWVADQPNVYYFSYATRSSFTGALTGWEYALPTANVLISAFHDPGFMGNYTRNEAGYPVIDSSWWKSDGVVNTRAMKAPTIKACGAGFCATGSVVNDISGGGVPQVGKWNYKGLMDGWDHLDIVGWTLFWDSTSWYKQHIDQLRSL